MDEGGDEGGEMLNEKILAGGEQIERLQCSARDRRSKSKCKIISKRSEGKGDRPLGGKSR